MADTGENRQIIGRVNAKEAETVRASNKMVSEEQSAARARNATFGGAKKGKGSKQGSPSPKASNKATR